MKPALQTFPPVALNGSTPDPHATPLPNLIRSDDDQGLVTLTFDHPDSSVNVFDLATLHELEAAVAALAGDTTVRGVIFVSAKPAVFLAGADLKALSTADAATLAEVVDLGQRIFSAIAALDVPTVAAIHGACLGGGLELALACDWRIVSDDKTTRLGLPETQLGILPAWGGTTRLPRLLGLRKGLELILTGKQLDGRRARKLGLADEVVPRERLEDMARQFVSKGKRPLVRHLENLIWPVVGMIGALARRNLRAKTRGLYPAPEKAISVAVRGVVRSVDASLDLERAAFLELVGTDACRNLMRTFLLQERAKRFSVNAESREIARTAVIGAGVMGGGIAQWLASRGLPVTLEDIDRGRLAVGLERIDRLFANSVERRGLTRQEAKEARDRIVPVEGPGYLERMDLVIEAATENLEIKKKIFRGLIARTQPSAVLATNTSALPIGELAAAVGDDEAHRVIGLHFFNPVHQMKLVEVVAGEKTSPETIETAVRFVRAIGKFPVVVADRPGFLVNRILMPYLIEAGQLVDSGVSAPEIDAAMLDFGMPMGPLRLLDEIGLDVAMHVARTMEEAYGERMAAPAILSRLASAGHLGKKSGCGFYAYGKGGERAVFRGKHRTMKRAEIAQRLSRLMVDEAQRCLDEGVAASADDIDFAMIFGTGFAPFRGGPMAYGRTLGQGKAEAVTAGRSVPTASVIDTSKMSAEQRAALELTEAARTQAGQRNSLAGSFFMGTPDLRRIVPFPEQSMEDRERGDVFLHRLRQVLAESVDADAIDREGEIPEEVLGRLGSRSRRATAASVCPRRITRGRRCVWAGCAATSRRCCPRTNRSECPNPSLCSARRNNGSVTCRDWRKARSQRLP